MDEISVGEQTVIVGVVVFISSFVAGLTSFGDAIMYHALMQILRLAGLYSEQTTASVFSITLMTMVSQPFMIIEMAGGPLRSRLRDGLVLSASGIPSVILGFWLLKNVDTSVLIFIIGALFLAFSMIKLSIDSWASIYAHSQPGSHATRCDEPGCIVHADGSTICGAATGIERLGSTSDQSTPISGVSTCSLPDTSIDGESPFLTNGETRADPTQSVDIPGNSPQEEEEALKISAAVCSDPLFI